MRVEKRPFSHKKDELEDSCFKGLYQFIFWGGLLFGLYYQYTSTIMEDQNQLLKKGYLLAFKNIWTHFGNLSSGGMGNIPGSFSTALVGLPLSLWNNPWSILFTIQIFHVGSFFLFDQILKSSHPTPDQKIGRLMLLTFYWWSPWRAQECILWNPAYLFFFSTLHWYSLKILLEKKSSAFHRFAASLLNVLSIGLVAQLHNSSLILALITMYFLFTERKIFDFRGLLLGGFVIVVSLIPYFQALQSMPAIAPVISEDKSFLGKGLLYVFPLIKALLYWPRYTSFYLPRYSMKYLDTSWIPFEALGFLIHGLKWVLGISSFLLALKIFYDFIKVLGAKKTRRAYLQVPNHRYIFASFLAMTFAAALSPITLLHWHQLILFPQAVYIWGHSDFLKRIPVKKTTFLLGWVLTAAAFNFFAATSSFKHNLRENFHTEYKDYLKEKEREFQKGLLSPRR